MSAAISTRTGAGGGAQKGEAVRASLANLRDSRNNFNKTLGVDDIWAVLDAEG